jgi:plasmid stabilization system protein ParE
MAKVIRTEGALLDVDEIADDITGDNADAANRLVRRIFTRVGLLETFPEMGRWVPEFIEHTHRELAAAPCRVVDRLHKGAAFIEAVVRGEQLVSAELLKRRKI